MKKSQLEYTELPIDQIVPYAQNAKLHPPSQISALAHAISTLGFISPIIVVRKPDGKYEIIAGHGRHLAAIEAGLKTVPAIIVSHLTEAEQRAYRIADNKLTEQGKWSLEMLQAEVKWLIEFNPDLGALDLGFETGELDFLLTGDGEKKKTEKEAPLADRSLPAVTQPGYVWTIAGQKVACADATDKQSYELLLGEERADMVISDMPWNVPVNGHVRHKGNANFPEFAMASGEMSRSEFTGFMRTVLMLQASVSRPGALNYQFIDWRSVGDMIRVGEEVYDALVNLCVWVKPVGGLGSLYRSRHELVCVFRVKGAGHDNFVNLGKHGRNRTNVWEYASPSAMGSERANLAIHPTCKNVACIADAIMDCTRRKAIVLDAFLGSGTTLLAAHRTGRQGRGIEIDPYYVDTAIRRLQEETGLVATLPDGTTFAEAERASLEEVTNG